MAFMSRYYSSQSLVVIWQGNHHFPVINYQLSVVIWFGLIELGLNSLEKLKTDNCQMITGKWLYLLKVPKNLDAITIFRTDGQSSTSAVDSITLAPYDTRARLSNLELFQPRERSCCD
jgi:hypothetical protein